MTLTITGPELRRYVATGKPFYVDTLLAHLDVLKEAGILANPLRLCHFLGQVCAETAGMTLQRESFAYRPARLRQVWPSRFRNADDATLAALCADPVKLADSVYGGRLGNRKGTSDGYDYRGGGWIQTTGRYNVEKYCQELGLEAGPKTLDDPVLTLKMACLEWEKSHCNEWADKDDVLRVSKVINTGSATSGIIPVGLEARETWTARAKRIWGNARDVDVLAAQALVSSADESLDHDEGPTERFVIPAADPPHEEAVTPEKPKAGVMATVTGALDTSDRNFAVLNELADKGSRAAQVVRKVKNWFWGALGSGAVGSQLVDSKQGTASLFVSWVEGHPFLFVAICASVLGVVLYCCFKAFEKYIVTAFKDGRYLPRD